MVQIGEMLGTVPDGLDTDFADRGGYSVSQTQSARNWDADGRPHVLPEHESPMKTRWSADHNSSNWPLIWPGRVIAEKKRRGLFENSPPGQEQRELDDLAEMRRSIYTALDHSGILERVGMKRPGQAAPAMPDQVTDGLLRAIHRLSGRKPRGHSCLST